MCQLSSWTSKAFGQDGGMQCLHAVRRKAGFKTRRSILTPGLFTNYQDMQVWRGRAGSTGRVVGPHRIDRHDATTSKDTP